MWLVSAAGRNRLLQPYEPRNAMRAGIEGMLSEGIRRHWLRRARYRGSQRRSRVLHRLIEIPLVEPIIFSFRKSVTIAFACA